MFLFCSRAKPSRLFARVWASPCRAAEPVELAGESIPFNAPAVRDAGFSGSASAIGMLAL
jgi:hypothetical protein